MTRAPHRRPARGFTLVEVMLALAILGLALTMLVRSLAGNVNAATEAQMMGIVTELARGKMYDVEEKLRKDGFMDTDQSSNGDFSEEGWSTITWSSKVEIPEIPGLAALQAMQAGKNAEGKDGKDGKSGDGGGSGKGSGSGSGGADDAPTSALDSFASSGLGGMLSMFGGDLGSGGGGMAGDAASQLGQGMIQQYFDMVQQVFKASIRKVTLTIQYTVGPTKHDFELIAYFTDDSAMDKVIGFDLQAVQETLNPPNPPNPPGNPPK